MDGLLEQLLDDITNLFKNNTEYSNMVVKEIYDIFPDISYPLTTIQEIENSDNARFFDETERVTNLTYQFTINAEQTLNKTAIQNVREIAKIIDNYLKGPKYRCLRRIGALIIVPTSGDDNVMQGHLRYNCCLEKDTNTIYRRY